MDEPDGSELPHIFVTAAFAGPIDAERFGLMIESTDGVPCVLVFGRCDATALAEGIALMSAGPDPGFESGPLRMAASGGFRWRVAGAGTPARPSLSVEIPGRQGFHLTLTPDEARAIGQALLAQAGDAG